MKRNANQRFPAGRWADGENVADQASRRNARNGQPERRTPVPRPRRLVKTLALLALVVGMYVLHQDFWNWRRIEPLVFGFLPVGLAYHAAYSILAAGMMAVLVRFAWPKHLEAVGHHTTPVEQPETEAKP